MLSIENLRNAQSFIDQSKTLAKEVHDMIVKEEVTVGPMVFEALINANARAAAARMILSSLDAVEATGATELNKGASTVLLGMLNSSLQSSIVGNAHPQTIWMLNDYVRWLEGAIAEMA